jgi:aryl-alcohol dehydrogenase-like predicted oxidoreductase
MRRIAENHRANADQIALAAVLAQPWADVVLSGAATIDALRSNLGATRVTLDEQDLEHLARLAEPAINYWRSRSSLPWT